jgi:hypothetical protein
LLTILDIYRSSSTAQDLQPLPSNLFQLHDERIGLRLFRFEARETSQIQRRWHRLSAHTQLRIMALSVTVL